MTVVRAVPLAGGGLVAGRGLIVALVVAGLVVGLLIVVAGGLWGGVYEDPWGRRNRALFLGAAAFASLYLTLFAGFGVVTSLTSLLVPRPPVVRPGAAPGPSPFVRASAGAAPAASGALASPAVPEPVRIVRTGPASGAPHAVAPLRRAASRGDVVTSHALAAGLVALAGAVVFVFTGRRLRGELARTDVRGSPAARPLLTYLYGAAYVALFIAALAAASTLYGVFRVIAPGVSLTGSRALGGRRLIDSAYLAMAAGAIFVGHWRAAHRWTQPPPAAGAPGVAPAPGPAPEGAGPLA